MNLSPNLQGVYTVKYNTVSKDEVATIREIRNDHGQNTELIRCLFAVSNRDSAVGFRKKGKRYVVLSGVAVCEDQAPLFNSMDIRVHPNEERLHDLESIEMIYDDGIVLKDCGTEMEFDVDLGWREICEA